VNGYPSFWWNSRAQLLGAGDAAARGGRTLARELISSEFARDIAAIAQNAVRVTGGHSPASVSCKGARLRGIAGRHRHPLRSSDGRLFWRKAITHARDRAVSWKSKPLASLAAMAV